MKVRDLERSLRGIRDKDLPVVLDHWLPEMGGSAPAFMEVGVITIELGDRLGEIDFGRTPNPVFSRDHNPVGRVLVLRTDSKHAAEHAPPPPPRPPDTEREVRVCAFCLRVVCRIKFDKCNQAKEDKITTRTVGQLQKLGLEHDRFWRPGA